MQKLTVFSLETPPEPYFYQGQEDDDIYICLRKSFKEIEDALINKGVSGALKLFYLKAATDDTFDKVIFLIQ